MSSSLMSLASAPPSFTTLAQAADTASVGTPVVWFATIAGILLLFGLDFLITRRPHDVTMKEAIGWSIFYIAIPAVFGSGLYELVHSFGEPEGAYGYPETLVATVVAFVVGYAVIAFLMRYIEKRSFLPFVIYRILLGTTLIVLLSLGILSPL